MRHIVPSASQKREQSTGNPAKGLHYMHPDDLRQSSLQDVVVEAILQSRFTQSGLARVCGFSEAYLSKVVHGHAGLHGEWLTVFCSKTRSIAVWQWHSLRISDALQAEGFDFEALQLAAFPRLQ